MFANSGCTVTVARVFPKPSWSSLQLLMPLCTKEVVQVENLSNHVEFQVPFLGNFLMIFKSGYFDMQRCYGTIKNELSVGNSQVD